MIGVSHVEQIHEVPLLQGRQRCTRWNRWLATGALAVLSGAMLVADSRMSIGPEGRLASLYAYATTDKLVVMSGASEVMSVDGSFTSSSRLAWTLNGRYIAYVLPDEEIEANTKLVVLDVVSQTVRYVRCPNCYTDIAGISDSTLISFAFPTGTMWRFDLASSRPPVKAQWDVPVAFTMSEVWGGIPGTVLVAGYRSANGRREAGDQLYMLGNDGTVRKVSGVPQNGTISTATAMPDQQGDPTFAVQAKLRFSGGCSFYDLIYVMDVGLAALIRTDATAALPPEGATRQAHEAGFAVDTTWWQEGALRATFRTWGCDEQQSVSGRNEVQLVPVSDPSAWHLSQERWISDPNSLPRTVLHWNSDRFLSAAWDGHERAEHRLTFHDGAIQQVVSQDAILVVTPSSWASEG